MNKSRVFQCLAMAAVAAVLSVCGAQERFTFRGTIVDADTGQLLPARVYIQSDEGSFFFPRSTDGGSAVEYRETAGEQSVEMHTSGVPPKSGHPKRLKRP